VIIIGQHVKQIAAGLEVRVGLPLVLSALGAFPAILSLSVLLGTVVAPTVTTLTPADLTTATTPAGLTTAATPANLTATTMPASQEQIAGFVGKTTVDHGSIQTQSGRRQRMLGRASSTTAQRDVLPTDLRDDSNSTSLSANKERTTKTPRLKTHSRA
jgi:hypothetical protein